MQRRIGFAFGARCSGLGSACLAARRRHHGYDGLGYPGPAFAAVCTENLDPDVMVMKPAKDRV